MPFGAAGTASICCAVWRKILLVKIVSGCHNYRLASHPLVKNRVTAPLRDPTWGANASLLRCLGCPETSAGQTLVTPTVLPQPAVHRPFWARCRAHKVVPHFARLETTGVFQQLHGEPAVAGAPPIANAKSRFAGQETPTTRASAAPPPIQVARIAAVRMIRCHGKLVPTRLLR